MSRAMRSGRSSTVTGAPGGADGAFDGKRQPSGPGADDRNLAIHRALFPKNVGSGPRQPSRQLVERLISRIGGLARRRIDKLIDHGTEVDHDFFLMLIVAVEHHADVLVRAA